MSDWIDNLARLAEAATPGPWEVDDDDCGYASPDAPMVATPWVGGRRTHIVGSPARPHGKPLPENAEFIAAANPATILRLIEENRRLRDDLDAEVDGRKRADIWRKKANDTRRERDALRARLAAVEALADRWRHCGDPGDPRRQAASALRAALAAPTDTTKEN